MMTPTILTLLTKVCPSTNTMVILSKTSHLDTTDRIVQLRPLANFIIVVLLMLKLAVATHIQLTKVFT
jgi:hypothetical protein